MAREGARTAGGWWNGRVWLWWVASSTVDSAIVGGGIRFNTSNEGLIVLLCLGGAVIGIGQWALVLRGRVQGLRVGWWIAGSEISGCTPLVLLGTENAPCLAVCLARQHGGGVASTGRKAMVWGHGRVAHVRRG